MAKRNTKVRPPPTANERQADALGAILRGERPPGVRGVSVDGRGKVTRWPGTTESDVVWMLLRAASSQVAVTNRRAARAPRSKEDLAPLLAQIEEVQARRARAGLRRLSELALSEHFKTNPKRIRRALGKRP